MIIVGWIIEMVSGLVGGVAAGVAIKDKGLGLLWNSVAGFLGGGAVGFLAQKFIPSFGTAMRGSNNFLPLPGELVTGLAGGAAVMLLAALVKYLVVSRKP
jgi:uncharacterized membrane protein YeaQ/YmgE (transglycosylase-associated protein family)